MTVAAPFAAVLAAGAAGVACVVLGVTLLAMQAGVIISGDAARNPAFTLVKSVCGIALATLGFEILILIHP